MTQLFITLSGQEIAKISNLVRAESFFAAGVELRLDTLEKFSLDQVSTWIHEAHSHALKALLTVRPERQGGFFEGTEEERLELLEKLCALGPDLVDLEYDIPKSFKEKLSVQFPKILFLSSYHDFEKTPTNLEAILEEMLSPYAHIYKIAVTAHSSLDSLRVMHFVSKARAQHHVVGIAMGELGRITRILAPVYGNYLSFASATPTQNPGLGQLSFQELCEAYHYPSLNTHTEVFALIGGTVSHSKGPTVHNFVFTHFKRNACYVAIALQDGELKTFLKEIPFLSFKGLSVTMPLKELIVPYLDEVAASAKEIHRVNTVTIQGERLTGSNTDSAGALNAIEKHLPIQGKKVVIVGAGGAGGAIAYEARERGAQVCILNRSKDSALQLASLVGCEGGGLEELPRVFREGYDLLINSTPKGNEAIDSRWILPGCYAMDVVTTPKETPFLLECQKKGCHLILGLEMFVEQAILQQMRWPSSPVSETELRALIQKALNLS